MTTPQRLRALLAAATQLGSAGRRWHDRGRHISLVPDNSGMGATLPTNHVAAFAEKADCALVVSVINALPALLRIASAAEAWRRDDHAWSLELASAVDALTSLDATDGKS